MDQGSKSAIRQRLRALRSAIDRPAARQSAERMRENFLNANLLSQPPGAIAGYWPVRDEINCLPLLEALRARGFSCLLPVIDRPQSPLTFRLWHADDPIIHGPFSIPAPPPSQPRRTPDAVILPLIGFDRRGQRLGYGGGYYDRTMARLRRDRPTVLAIGVAYALQELPRIPARDHDQPLDAIVTESEVLYIHPELSRLPAGRAAS